MVGLWILTFTIYWRIQDVLVSTDWKIFSQFQRFIIFEVTINSKDNSSSISIKRYPWFMLYVHFKIDAWKIQREGTIWWFCMKCSRKYKDSVNISNKTCTTMVVSIKSLLLNAGCSAIFTPLELQKIVWKWNQYSKKHYCNIHSDIHKLSQNSLLGFVYRISFSLEETVLLAKVICCVKQKGIKEHSLINWNTQKK